MKIPNQAQCAEAAHVLKILSHPQRLMILCQLVDGRKNVSELENLAGISQSQVSQFLARMKSEGLVNCEREARSVYYEVADKRVLKLIQALQKIFSA